MSEIFFIFVLFRFTLISMYQLLKFLIGWGLRLYYREIHVINQASLQKKGPLILIANHPNTLMDAWLIALYARKDLHFLTKGTFFNSPIKSWFLRNLNMIPINRNVEERTKGVHNQDSFEACYEVLKEGKCLVIFPEGNSVMERLIRTFKRVQHALRCMQKAAIKANWIFRWYLWVCFTRKAIPFAVLFIWKLVTPFA